MSKTFSISNLLSQSYNRLQQPSYLTVIIWYIVIVIIQVIYTKYNLANPRKSKIFDEKVAFNKENYDALVEFFKQDMKERIDLLTSGKIKYNDWVDFINEENTITYKNPKTNKEYKYYYFLWEKGKNPSSSGSTYTAIAHLDKKYINMNWDDVYKDSSELFVYVRQTIDPNLIKSLFELGKPGNQIIKYNWADPVEKLPVLKISLINVIPETKEHGELALGIGMDVANLNEISSVYYVNNIHYLYIALISLSTLIVAIIFYLFSLPQYRYKSLVFLFFSNLYFLYFLNSREYTGTPDTEIKKIEEINSRMLGASFLVGVNTYILTQLTNNKTKDLFIQSALIFSISIILLLVASFKITDSITISELIEDRIGNQLVFNFSVLLNIVLVVNYLIFVLRKKINL